MKINTDLVKGKKYSSAVKPNTLKHSQEYRVLATLRYLYPSKFDTMITGEAPDLQDSANSTGIEVTAAVKEDDMKVSRAFSELNQGKPKDIEKRKNIIKSSGYFFVPHKDEKVAISTSGTTDGEKRFFQESIRRKTKITEKHSLTQDESLSLATIGRMTAEGELTMTDTEWQ